jgi:hypothetical protein
MSRHQAESGGAQSEYRQLKRHILDLDWARPGSVIRRFMACGNPACRCMGQPPQLHGPYFQWSHKIGGKTVSLRLNDKQARLALEWAENYKQLRRLLRRMDQIALRETGRILGSIS